MPQDWDAAAREVLQENTAQAIFQQLSKQESLKEKYAKSIHRSAPGRALSATDAAQSPQRADCGRSPASMPGLLPRAACDPAPTPASFVG